MAPSSRIAFVLAITLAASGCDDRGGRTRRVLEPYALVPGSPQVDQAAPQVQTDPTRATGHFAINVLRQCDLFQQVAVRKVDILWVVDSSGSMAPKQARLAANFSGFINELLAARPPIDFHIAVTSTDTDDPAARGALRTWTLGSKSGNFISCTPDVTGASVCNTDTTPDAGTDDAVTAFTQMATVGTAGSAQERGLLAAFLSLSDPNNQSTSTSTKFIRPDAALYVVVVSDEDDASCVPMQNQALCTADPGCRCAPESTLQLDGGATFGSAAHFARFLESYKGYGNQDLVALAAIVALDGSPDAGVPSQFGDPRPHVGCCRSLNGQPCPTSGENDGGFEVAYFGDRYVRVAEATGGVAVSICEDNFAGALSALGYAASGLRKDFRLTRGPELKVSGANAAGLDVYVSPSNAANCSVDGNCPQGQVCRSQRCAEKVAVSTQPAPNGAQYQKCNASALRNAVHFDGTAVPESLSTVEICYDVAADFEASCP